MRETRQSGLTRGVGFPSLLHHARSSREVDPISSFQIDENFLVCNTLSL